MPKIIAISGEIGWDVWPDQIREQLAEAAGEEIEVQISSPGGYIYDGLEIFNLIRRYPGKTTTVATGLAASMASYLLMAGDVKKATSNAIFMIHNARVYSYGDQNEHRKTANVLEGMSNLLSKEYQSQTKKEKVEITKMMDEETFLFGDEILASGFVDEIIEVEDVEEAEKDDLVIAAMLKVEAVFEKIRSKPEDINKIAASMTTQPTGKKPTQSPEPPATNNPQGANMDITKFLAFLENHPEAKAFFTAYQAENRVDFEKIPLTELLEKAPAAKAEHDQIVTDAKAALESEKINKADVKFIAGILSSEAYAGNKALAEAGQRVLCQETTIDIFKMFVAQADQFNEMKKDLQIKNNQPPKTPGDPSQGAGGGKSKDEVLAQAQAQGQSMGTAKKEDK